jgi:DNA-binding MarR family transcriptional regulator
MTLAQQTQAVLRLYPEVFFACHCRHVRDDRTGRSLSARLASILDHLDADEPVPLHILARHMGVTASTMSLQIDRLEAGGYVERKRDAGDARRVEIRLTAAGLRLNQRQKVLEPELVGALLRLLDPRDRRRALDGLDLLAQAARKMALAGELQRFRRAEHAFRKGKLT